MARAAARERLHKPLKRRILRKRIPRVETIFGAVFLALLAAIGVWIADRKDRFDPAERDVSFAVLQKDSVEDTLYRAPLRRWVEPGSASAATPAAIDLGLFPAGLLDGGWELDGRVETYDAENLYEKINGAAEQYLAFGFRQLHYVTLARDEGFLNVELYDQGSFGNALGLFAAQRDGDRAVQQQDQAYYYATPAGAVGGFRNYYFKIAGDSASQPIRSKAAELVGLLPRISGEAAKLPLPYAVLTGPLGLSLDRIAYARSDAFQYDFLSDFWFGRVGPDSDARYFLHEAGDAGEAGELFDRLVEEQLFDYEAVERGDDRVLLRHGYLNTIFALSRRGNLLYGVEGAESPERSREYLSRLDEVVAVEGQADPAS